MRHDADMSASLITSGLKLQVADTYEAMSQAASAYLAGEIENQRELLFCASAGSTPARTYQLLAGHPARQTGGFNRLRVLKIDEWGGIAMDDPGSCETGLRTQLLRPLNITPDRYQGFESQPGDFKQECERIARWLSAHGPIDVCLLGLGLNGHIALNEPAEVMAPHAHPACLTEESLGHPMLRASAQKPSCGLTLGMADILQSRRILLLVNGAHKQVPLRRLLKPEISPQFPASFLWLHPDVTVLCDQAAAL
jgi:galactosamine-6-phosphate isomerase